MVAKQHYYHGLAQYKMGCTARDEKSFGQAIARMQVSHCTNIVSFKLLITSTNTRVKL